jgi:hypothetical protein
VNLTTQLYPVPKLKMNRVAAPLPLYAFMVRTGTVSLFMDVSSVPGHCTVLGTVCRSQWSSGLRRGSEADGLQGLRVRTPPGAGCLSVLSVTCHLEVSATGRSLVQRTPSDCGVSLSVI